MENGRVVDAAEELELAIALALRAITDSAIPPRKRSPTSCILFV